MRQAISPPPLLHLYRYQTKNRHWGQVEHRRIPPLQDVIPAHSQPSCIRFRLQQPLVDDHFPPLLQSQCSFVPLTSLHFLTQPLLL